MCIGVPMRVIRAEPRFAWCEGRGERRRVDTALIGDPEPGTWVLVFMDAAREVLDEHRAAQVNDALDALEAALRGEPLDDFFPDLVDREPRLPEFLRPPARDSIENPAENPIEEQP